MIEENKTPATVASVALVEDDPRTRNLIADLLRKAGFVCGHICADAEAAQRTLVEAQPDIVLMDIDLPGASGIECVRFLKPRMAHTHFVMLTVYDNPESIFEALSVGAIGYILKRSAASDLVAALRDVLAGGSPMTSSVARKVVASFQSTGKGAPEIDLLSQRENQVLHLLAQGKMYKEIADILGIKNNTVSCYIRRIYEKLHVRSRMQAVAKLSARH